MYHDNLQGIQMIKNMEPYLTVNGIQLIFTVYR